MLAPDRYFGTEQGLLIHRYIEVCAQLGSLHIEHKDCLVEEKKARQHAYFHSTEASIAGRERDADAHSLNHWIATQEAKASILECQEERDMLINLIWGNDAR